MKKMSLTSKQLFLSCRLNRSKNQSRFLEREISKAMNKNKEHDRRMKTPKTGLYQAMGISKNRSVISLH
jgi:hypothetical protein